PGARAGARGGHRRGRQASAPGGERPAWHAGSRSLVVQVLQELVRGELDLLMPPLGRPVVACDDAHAMDATEIPVDKRVPGLGVGGGTVGEPEMPSGVFLPPVRLPEGLPFAGVGLNLAPVAAKQVLALVDELSRPVDGLRVHGVRGHYSIFSHGQPCQLTGAVMTILNADAPAHATAAGRLGAEPIIWLAHVAPSGQPPYAPVCL